MKNNLTELVFILDRSGSMGGLEGDTIGGYNSMLKKQQELPGETVITTVLFDHKYELLHDRTDLKAVNPITDQDYFVRGSTALLDAVGMSIQKIKAAQKNIKEEFRPEKTMFVITTDGMENASREYTYDKVRQLVEEQKEKACWEFIFLGANIDAIKTAGSFGIDADRAVNYHADGAGTELNYKSINMAISDIREGRPLTADWKSGIEKDYKRRSKKN